MTDTRLHSVLNASRTLGVSEWTIFALIRRGELHSVKIGARRLIPESALQDYVAKLGEQAALVRTDSDLSA